MEMKKQKNAHLEIWKVVRILGDDLRDIFKIRRANQLGSQSNKVGINVVEVPANGLSRTIPFVSTTSAVIAMVDNNQKHH